MSQTVSAVSRRLLMALRLLCLMLIALHLLASLLPEEQAWGLWPYTYLPPLWRWLLALLALLACLPGYSLIAYRLSSLASSAHTVLHNVRHATCDMRHAIRDTRYAMPPRCLLFVAIALAFAPLFWLGRIVHTRWGDAYILVHAIPHPDVRLTYNWQAPLDIFLHAKFWALGHRLFGWADAMPAYWVLSTVAGVGFIFVLCHLADALGGERTEKGQVLDLPLLLTFGLVASLGTMQLFFGYIESYTFICLGILAYLWLARRCLRGGEQDTDLGQDTALGQVTDLPLLGAAVVLALTHGFHPSTLVLQPSLWFLGWTLWRQGKVKGTEVVLKVLLPSLIVALGVLALMETGGHGLAAFLGEDFPGGGDHRWLVPLLRTTTRWEHYTMFSWAHLLDIVNEQLLTAPVVLPTLLLVAALARRRLDGSDPTLRFLLLAAGSYLFLTLVWNPDYGGRRDWDLFAPASLPLTVLAAYVLPLALPERAAQRAAGWMLIAVQVMHSAAWVYQNTRPWAWP